MYKDAKDFLPGDVFSFRNFTIPGDYVVLSPVATADAEQTTLFCKPSEPIC